MEARLQREAQGRPPHQAAVHVDLRPLGPGLEDQGPLPEQGDEAGEDLGALPFPDPDLHPVGGVPGKPKLHLVPPLGEAEGEGVLPRSAPST